MQSKLNQYGWVVSNDEKGQQVIQKDDEMGRFKSDEEAVLFVEETYFEMLNLLEDINDVFGYYEVHDLLTKIKGEKYAEKNT